MRRLLIIIISVVSLNVFASCDIGNDAMADTENIQGDSVRKTKGNQMKVTIGTKAFEATLVDNETVTALKEMLPLRLEMSELNGNEKLFRFSNSLPEKASNPGTIHAGDLMLWGSNTLVLFYETFPTSYSYTRIGRIKDPAGLAQAVGSGSVMVSFEIE
ncbi:cyclophilin-like fold protein [Pontibacter sp. 13R65]|uniref:cyclophilin-like fold protein n=1 Tax=Pontibacter sp. 13R65 TaxID=3127458 RepID=UPI00301E3EAA